MLTRLRTELNTDFRVAFDNLPATQADAILAALRLLASSLNGRGHILVEPNDGDVGDILTCTAQHSGLSADQVHDIADILLHGYVVD